MPESVVLITGALTGVGRATAKAFARLGHVVVAAGRYPEGGVALATELVVAGATDAVFVEADASSETKIAALVDSIKQRYGRLDVAVNNVGAEVRPTPIVDLNPEFYSSVFDTNVLGTMLSMKHELRVMQAQGSGTIVNVTSVDGGSNYVGAKDAIIGLTRSAALEAATYGVRVNVVGGPGQMDAALAPRRSHGQRAIEATIPHGPGGSPDELAQAIVLIAGTQGSYLTGQVIYLDDGGGLKAG